MLVKDRKKEGREESSNDGDTPKLSRPKMELAKLRDQP
jgi:hypothetical protein